jgi:hypothetical protein
VTDCQRWRSRRASYRPAGEPINPALYGVEAITERDAKAFVTGHHYSGTYPAARLRVGLHRVTKSGAAALVGVAVFSVPMQQQVITRWTGQAPDRGVELGRFVLLDEEPANAETWFLARAFKVLRAALPEVRAVLSYSDPVPRQTSGGEAVMPGHVGTIYRAFNGRFVGRSSSRTLLLGPDGRAMSERSVSKVRNGERGAEYAERQLMSMGAPPRDRGESGEAYARRALTCGAFRRQKHPGNLAYVWAFDKAASAALPGRVPYPAQCGGVL